MSGVPTRIPITRPVFGPEEFEAIRRPLESGWVAQGPFVEQFERRFAAFTGSPFAAATSSCTTALHVALTVLGVRRGDEVIVPAFTWISTANVVEYMGARPIFCDIDLGTFNVDAERLASLITPRTVGIIPVHLFGLCADMGGILRLAERHHLWVIEDAACAFGARYGGRHAGTFGQMGCFSFHPRKAITTGEGGMITTARRDFCALAQSLRDHGASRSDLARHEGTAGFLLADYPHLGFNYRMTDLQGALGCAQMDRAQWILAERTRLAGHYHKCLADVAWLVRPAVPDGHEHGYQAYVCLFRPEPLRIENVERLYAWRNGLMLRMDEQGIATRQGTHAPVLQPYYAEKYGLRPEQFPNAYFADRLTLTLPLYPQMNTGEIELVCASLAQALNA